MDVSCDAQVEGVVVAGCSQFGKTEWLLNTCGYYMQHDPCPILLVQPTLMIAEAFSKDRFAPMVRDTPCIHDLIESPRSRDSGNTILHKQFPGGHLTMAGANSPASLASRPIRVVMCDEVDRYDSSAGTEGDPVNLAFKRTKAFWNRKRLLTSSRTRTNSRIDQAFDASDRRFFLVPCPHCKYEQVLHWNPLSNDPKVTSRVRWDGDDPDSARFYCTQCEQPWDDSERMAALLKGYWKATKRFRGTAGFQVWGLMIMWQTMSKLVAEWFDARDSGDQEQIRVFINTEIGDNYDDDGEHVSDEKIKERRDSSWAGTIPEGVYFTTAGLDVQGDRIEAEHVGWGHGEVSWSLEYRVFHGDPGSPDIWADVDRWLLSIRPSATCVDSGGHFTQQVYRFCSARFKRRVYAIKGKDGMGRIVWPRVASRGKGGARVYIIGVDAAKDTIFAHLKVGSPQKPGYCHIPGGREEWWYTGLTSESVHTKNVKGLPVRYYKLRPGFRNEPLDCRVYAFAALCSFGKLNWGRLAKKRAKQIEATQKEVVNEVAHVHEHVPPTEVGGLPASVPPEIALTQDFSQEDRDPAVPTGTVQPPAVVEQQQAKPVKRVHGGFVRTNGWMRGNGSGWMRRR